MKQTSFEFVDGNPVAYPMTRLGLESLLSRKIGRPVEVTVTDNRRTMISSQHRGDAIVLRIHHMFLKGDSQMVKDLASYLRGGGKGAGERIDAFIDTHIGRVRKGVSLGVQLITQGVHHDLQTAFDALNRSFFDSQVRAKVTWGRRHARGVRRRRRSIRLGSYCADEGLIRVHRVLDQDWVPDYVVRAVLHHEMLHELVPPRVVRGKKWFHTTEFRERERAFPEYQMAHTWEKANLDRLLSQ